MVFLLLGGEITDHRFLKQAWDTCVPQALICADGGACHAWQAQLTPTLIVGDLDSLPPDLGRYYRAQGIPYASYPSAKDETDGILAMKYALQIHPTEIRVFGACGGRIDHTLANLSLLLLGVEAGVPVVFTTETYELFLVTRQATVEGQVGDIVSLLALFDDAQGVCLDGFTYPLTEGVIKRNFPLGMSNVLVAPKAQIRVRDGSLIVVHFSLAAVEP